MNDQPEIDQRPSEAELIAAREALAAEQRKGQERLDTLEAAAAAAEAELAEHDVEAERYQLLAEACDAIENLEEAGVAELFWGDRTGEPARAQLRQARDRIDAFSAGRQRLVDKHQAALGEIYGQQEALELVDYDLYQAMQREESRRREWIVEREAQALPARFIAMPWMRGFEEDKRFNRTLAGAIAASLFLGLIIPLIDLPIPERSELEEVPERFAQLIREAQELPPPPPLAPEPEELPEETETEEEPEEIEEVPVEPAVAVEAEPESTRDKVSSVGILAFRQNFSNLSESRPAAKLGAEARVSQEGDKAVGLPQRNMVAAQGVSNSGGINLASISRDVTGGEGGVVEGVALTRVASSIDGGGPDDRPRAAGAAAGRTDEEIQIVFDRYKAALYRLYNRELRRDPTLRGQMVLRLTIEPNGTVSLCGLQSSDMDAPTLAEKVINSVSAFQFGEKDVPAVTILYPIDFLPTA